MLHTNLSFANQSRTMADPGIMYPGRDFLSYLLSTDAGGKGRAIENGLFSQEPAIWS